MNANILFEKYPKDFLKRCFIRIWEQGLDLRTLLETTAKISNIERIKSRREINGNFAKKYDKRSVSGGFVSQSRTEEEKSANRQAVNHLKPPHETLNSI